MKLAFTIFKYYPYGGLQRDCLRFAEYCAKAGHEVHIFTMSWSGAKPKVVNVHLLPTKGFSNHIRAINFAKQLSGHLGTFDKVIGYNRMPGLDYYFAGDLSFADTAQKKRGSYYQWFPRYRNFVRLEKAVFAKGVKTKIFILTNQVKKSYQNFYETEDARYIFVPAGIQKVSLTAEVHTKIKQQLRKKLNIAQDKIVCLHVGSDFKRKGLERSIRAIASLPEATKKRIQFYVLGKGKAASYEKLTKELKISEQIQFLGTCDIVPEYMQAADLLLHPAHFETAGMVLVEALSFALPVLVTENCGYAFHIQDANAGVVLAEPFDQATMNEFLLTLLDKNTLKPFSQNALDYANKTDLYSMDQVCLQSIES